MPKKIQNASTLPRIYYGLHMCEGVAHYKPKDAEPYTIFVGETAAKNLDSTFVGRPVYVDHVPDVDLDNLENESDGYVVDSFFNKADGKHWAKFIVVTDRGHEAIRNGFKLSNAYIVQNEGPGGVWHGVEYSAEVLQAEYEHMAIVKDPRYAESIILTPDQFREYNIDKEKELKRLENSNDKTIKGDFEMFKIFKKQKMENASDINFSEMMITLPKSGRDVSFERLVNMAEEEKEKKENGDDKVKVGDEEMTVNELKEKYMNMCKKKNEEDEEAKKKKENEDDEKKKEENMSDEEKEKKENEEKEKKKEENEDDVKKAEKALKNALEKKNNFNKIANANINFDHGLDGEVLDLASDKVARGQSRYGSK